MARVTLAILGLLAAVACGGSSRVEAPTSLVLVTLDTTRVDHLSAYGYARDTSPRLAAFAREAVRFDRAWSTSSWTLPAHASLFTGLVPARHGARFDAQGSGTLGTVVNLPVAEHVRAGRLEDSFDTLAEQLAGRGYATGAVVAGPWLHRSFGLLQGFTHRDDAVAGFAGRPAEQITDGALAWLATVDGPYFLFVNYFDPHMPFRPLPGYDDYPRARDDYEPSFEALVRGESRLAADQRAILVDRYDGEIRYMDHHLGRLLDAVAARDEAPPLVVITGDHGEALGEGGRFGHTFWLSEELTRVPLIVRYPDGRGAGSVDERPVSLVDVWPLVADVLGLDAAAAQDGRALGTRTAVHTELYREPTAVLRFGEAYDRDLGGIVEWPYKLIRASDGGRVLYRLREGVGEEIVDAPEIAARLEAALSARESEVERAPVSPVGEVDPEMREALRRLGYVD